MLLARDARDSNTFLIEREGKERKRIRKKKRKRKRKRNLKRKRKRKRKRKKKRETKMYKRQSPIIHSRRR